MEKFQKCTGKFRTFCNHKSSHHLQRTCLLLLSSVREQTPTWLPPPVPCLDDRVMDRCRHFLLFLLLFIVGFILLLSTEAISAVFWREETNIHSITEPSHLSPSIKPHVFIKPFLHQLMSQSAEQKPSLKPPTASNAGVVARWLGKTP